MSILSTLNKLTGKSDKNVLAALNSLTGKTADDIEEAIGNLSVGEGGSSGEGSGTKLIPIRFVWEETISSSGTELTQDQINKILKRGIQSTFFWKWDGDEIASESWWGQQTEVEPGVFQGEAPVGAIVELVYTPQSDFDSDLRNIYIKVNHGLAEPFIGQTPSIFDLVPVFTREVDSLLLHSFVVPDKSSVTFQIGAGPLQHDTPVEPSQ